MTAFNSNNFDIFSFNRMTDYVLNHIISNGEESLIRSNLISTIKEDGDIDRDLTINKERLSVISKIIREYNCDKPEWEKIHGGFCRDLVVQDAVSYEGDRGRLYLYISQ